MKNISYFIIFFCAINGTLIYGQTQNEKLYPPKKLLKDFDYLFKQLEEVHPNCYAYISKENLDAKKSATRLKINHPMTRFEFYKLITPVLCSTNDGHTQSLIYQFDEVQNIKNSKLFPLRLKYYNDHYYIIKSSDASVHKGDILLSINDIPIDTITSEISKYINGETKILREVYVESMFREHLWFLFGFEDTYKVTIKTTNNSIHSYKIKDKSSKELYGKDNAISYYSYKTLDSLSKIGYFKLRHFVDKHEIDSFAETMFQQIQQDSINNLIIDLRGNNGGNGNTAALLLDYISNDTLYDMLSKKVGLRLCKSNKQLLRRSVAFYYRLLPLSVFGKVENDVIYIKNSKRPPSENPLRYNGNVYVLIDEGSYSASIVFTLTVQNKKRGIIIGKETGGYTTIYVPAYICTLPNTKIEVEIPNIVQVFNPEDTTLHGVIPDFEINDNPLMDNDEVLDYTLKLIQNKAAKEEAKK